jgi:hypothetical protein
MRLAALPPTLLAVALSLFDPACSLDHGGIGAVNTTPDGGGLGGAPGAGGLSGDDGPVAPEGGAGGAPIDVLNGTDAGPDALDGAPGDVGFPSPIGCADGTREGYLDLAAHPRIAACAGGWEVAGLILPVTRAPLCDRQGGNSGPLPDGFGCTAADLCADGWHVCETAGEVASLAGDCTDAFPAAVTDPTFYVTRQRALANLCEPDNEAGANNLHGCGNAGIGSPDDASCAPLTRMVTGADCTENPPWSCMAAAVLELDAVTKRGSSGGGVLCCQD